MDPFSLRKQLQENALDLQDYCKDLKSWGEEMKRKEETLRNGDKKDLGGTGDQKKVKKTNQSDRKLLQKDTATTKPVSRLGATDYAAWDKFDAEAECERLNDDINDDSELTDECNDNLQDLALIEKEKGNKFVKNKQWDEAIKCYSKAIEYYSYDPVFYANRALCYLKKKNYEEAEKDCTLSLKLDSTYVKAYQRRAAAREALNKLEHAECDLSKVLELEPKNKESNESLGKLRAKLGRTEKVAEQRPVSKFTASRNKSNINKAPHMDLNRSSVQSSECKKVEVPVPSWPEENDIILVKPIKKPPHLRSQKPLKRIKITEKGFGVSEPQAVKQQVFEKQEQDSIKKPVQDVLVVNKQRGESVSEKIKESSTAWPRSNQTSLFINSDDFKIVEKKPPDVSTDQPETISKELKNTSNINISNGTNRIEKPKTSVQFNLTWKNLKGSEERYKYLKQVDPQDLPRILLNSLEANVFSGVLEVLVKHFVENKDPVFDILDCFTRVKRFGTFTMFLSSSDKNNLWKLFDYVKEVEGKNKEDVDRLIDKYEL
ncbi:hypothetical protein NQ315_009820 [Exocentrus adspersus]|uniref:RNA polymerase II-associated protein 3 n=1 Tax=Exocentrus adspersus TaxID=1586481 RepID=A0AAV8WHC0_9CUCU|nr:hypothetical protein NQ315_009820 [Exocentrus adspersus]